MSALRIIKESFIKFYDGLFKYIFLNIFWFSLLILPFYLEYIISAAIIRYIGMVYLLILSGPLILSGFQLINNSLNREDTGIKEFLLSVPTNFKRGFRAFLFTVIGFALITFDFIFFAQSSENLLMMIVRMIFFYLFIVFSMLQIYYWSLLTIQRDTGILKIIKKSFFLVLDNLWVTVLIFLFMIIVFIIALYMPFIIPVFMLVLIALVFLLTTRTILKKYEKKLE